MVAIGIWFEFAKRWVSVASTWDYQAHKRKKSTGDNQPRYMWSCKSLNMTLSLLYTWINNHYYFFVCLSVCRLIVMFGYLLPVALSPNRSMNWLVIWVFLFCPSTDCSFHVLVCNFGIWFWSIFALTWVLLLLCINICHDNGWLLFVMSLHVDIRTEHAVQSHQLCSHSLRLCYEMGL